MPSIFEKLDNNQVKLTMTISPEDFEAGLQKAYLKGRGKINMPGFRAGKAPRKVIETAYGKEAFYEDAVNEILPEAYETAIVQHNLDVVSRPQFDAESMDKETGAVITATFDIKPELEISNYLGLKYKKPEETATDEEINAAIQQELQKNSRMVQVTERSVIDGDVANIDFEGFVDGTAFEGGKGEGYELKIGSNSFIDTFEAQIVGKSIGDEFDVNVTFPDPYNNADLAGKPAVFKCKLNGIQVNELPEADDDFAQEVSEFDTIEEYKNDIKANIEKSKKENAEAEIESQLIAELIKILDAGEPNIPDSMFDNELDNLVRDFAQRLQSQGMNFEMYMNYTGTNVEQLKESFRPNAVNNVKGRLALEAAAKAEKLTVADDELIAELDSMADKYKIERDKIEDIMGKREIEMLKKDLVIKKTLKKIVESAVAE